jgi:hypothetical protein
MEVDTNQLNQAHLNDQHYLVMHNKTLKCVCELCTCGMNLRYFVGKHRCPRPRLKGNFSTSYTDHYKDIKIAPSNATRLEYKY